MRRVLLQTLLLTVLLIFPIPAKAELSIGINFSLPPPVVFAAPPELIVLPGTYVYVAPDMDEDFYFYNGWWWRPWRGHWYRSRNYGSGWAYYRNVPSFYRGIPEGWRHNYREHRWQGRPWEYQRIPHHQLHRNWKSWESNRHWEKQRNWGVEGLRSPHPSREMQSRQQRTPSREFNPERSPQYRNTHERQSREPSNPHVKDYRSERSRQHGNYDQPHNGPQEQRSRMQQSDQKIQPRQDRSQPPETKPRRPDKQRGNPDNVEEESQGRR